MRMKKLDVLSYEAPQIECEEVAAENGFALSGDLENPITVGNYDSLGEEQSLF